MKKIIGSMVFSIGVMTATLSQAATIYWDGTTAAWNAVANWSTASGATTPDPAAVPGSGDDAVFNITTVNGPITVNMAGNQATNSLTFNNTGTTALTGGGTNRIFTLGAGGVVINSGAGAVTLGSGTSNQNVALSLGASQSWTNNSAALLTAANGISLANAGAQTLTITGSGNTTLSGIVANGTGTLSLAKSGAGTLTLSAANTFTGGITLSAGTLTLGNNASLGAATSVLTITGGALDVTAARTTTNNNVQNWNGDFTFTGTNTWNTGTGAITLGGASRQVTVSASTMTAGGVIGDGGNAYGLTKAGAGTLVLAATNTYTGATTISGGTLSAGTTGNLGGAASNLVFDGGTLQITGTTLTNVSGIGHTVTTNSGKTVGLDINNAANIFTFDQVLNQGTGGLTKLGTGTLVLNQTNTYSGATTIGAGTLSVTTVGNSGASSNLGSNGTINIGDATTGGTLVYTGTGETSDKVINLAGTTGGATITQSGTGSLVFTNNVTASGLGNKILTLGGATAGTGEISGVISDSAGFATSVTKAGSGTWTLSGANTYSGLTNLNGASGTLIMSGSNSSAGATTAQSGTLVLNSVSNGGLASGLLTLGSGGAIQVATAATLTNAVTLASGSGGFGINGSQNLTFSGDVTFTNQTNKGFVNNLTGGALLTFNGALFNLSVASGNIYASSGAGSTVINSVIQTGAVGTAGGLSHSTGILTLAGANTYAGGTTLNSGTLRINNGGSSSSNSAIGTGLFTIAGGTIDNTSGGAIVLLTNNAQTWNSGFTFTGTNDLNLGTGAVSLGTNTGTTRTVTTTAGNLTVGGAISNGTTAIGLIKAGAGQLTLTGTNTYTGPTTIQDGNLSVSSLNSVVSGSAGSSLGAPVTVANGTIGLGATTTTGQLTYTGSGETTDRVLNLSGAAGGAIITQSGTGLLKFTSATTATGAGIKTLTLQGSTAGSGEIGGAIVNNSGTNKTSVAKAGTGVWTLSGTNTYTGTTTVSGGTLLINGSLAAGSVVTVNAGTLGGSGTINGNTTIASGGTLAPGNSPGILTFNGTLTLAGATAVEINGLVRGTDYDGINTGAGLLTLGGGLTLNFGSIAATTTYDIFNVGAGGETGSFSGVSLAGLYSGSLTNSGGTWTGSNGGYSFSFVESTGDLTVAAVPEPSTYAMLGMGLGALWFLRRKRS